MALARNFDARLTALHVIEDPPTYGAMPAFAAPPVAVESVVRAQAVEELARFVEPALLDHVPVSREVRRGVPWREISYVAATLPADLVVMGTHGRGGFDRFILGSVTEQVLGATSCPLLTVCHEEGRTWAAPGLISHIVCATDLSDSSRSTIDFALALAAENQARVTFLHVIEGVPEDGLNDYVVGFRRSLAESRGRGLHEAIPEEARAWCEVTERVEVGKAHRRILELATRERADLIVMGDREANPVETMLFGSTARHVIRAATCPVLSVRRAKLRETAKEATGLAVVGER
jgi:nucleotide-binding universal stress UspA family protein